MPRPKSVILTPAEKKEALATAKAELREAKAAAKAVIAFIKEKEKLHAQTIREETKKLKEAEKVVEGINKRIASLTA